MESFISKPRTADGCWIV
jgi:hypothetical protein